MNQLTKCDGEPKSEGYGEAAQTLTNIEAKLDIWGTFACSHWTLGKIETPGTKLHKIVVFEETNDKNLNVLKKKIHY